MENNLPKGWSKAPLKTFADARMGETILAKELTKSGVPVYSAGQDNTPWGFVEKPKKIHSKGTIIVSARGSIGFPKIPINDRFASTQTTIALKLQDEKLASFCCLWLRTINWSELTKGGAIPMLTVGDINELIMPLPPEKERDKILSRLEVLLPKVKDAQSRLDKIPTILGRFRQSVLAAAFSGCLTADWREKNQSSEDIDIMLEAIKKRRDGKAKTAAQKNKLREIFLSSEKGDLSELPESWRYVFLNKLCDSFDYGTSAKSKPSGKTPVLRMGNIQDGEIDWTDLVYTSDAEEIKNYYLQPNTVLFNRTNSPELVGKTAIYRGERPAIFAGYLIRINPSLELDPEYLNLCLNTIYAKEFCYRIKTDGVSQSNVNAQKLGTFEIPFCPLAEQHEIVRRVKLLFKLADQIEARYAKARAQVDKLTQSILAKAFRGELVSQEA